MDYTALKTEIETDPAGLGYCVDGVRKPDPEILALINAVDTRWTYRPEAGKIPLTNLLGYLTRTGIMARLRRLENAIFPAHLADAPQETKDILQSCGIAVPLLFTTSGIGNIDIDNSDTQAIAGALLQAGIINQTEYDGILALSDLPTSRAIYLFGDAVTEDNVERSH
jgi:hypothetical protein